MVGNSTIEYIQQVFFSGLQNPHGHSLQVLFEPSLDLQKLTSRGMLIDRKSTRLNSSH